MEERGQEASPTARGGLFVGTPFLYPCVIGCQGDFCRACALSTAERSQGASEDSRYDRGFRFSAESLSQCTNSVMFRRAACALLPAGLRAISHAPLAAESAAKAGAVCVSLQQALSEFRTLSLPHTGARSLHRGPALYLRDSDVARAKPDAPRGDESGPAGSTDSDAGGPVVRLSRKSRAAGGVVSEPASRPSRAGFGSGQQSGRDKTEPDVKPDSRLVNEMISARTLRVIAGALLSRCSSRAVAATSCSGSCLTPIASWLSDLMVSLRGTQMGRTK